MKICIVGGTGHISQSITKVLLLEGHDVTIFNRNVSGGAPEGVHQLIGDRNNRSEFELLMQNQKFDVAIDMICFNKEEALSDVKAFRNVKHFIQISTVCTYGIDFNKFPVKEDNPFNPITEYGKNKVEADLAFMDAYNQEGFPVTIIKPSTTYGPKIGLLRQIAWEFSWIDRIQNNQPILILGEGSALHQFLHVDDAAECFKYLVGRKKCIGQTYHLVGEEHLTWKIWHETAMDIIGKRVPLVGVTLELLEKHNVLNIEVCREIFAHNCIYSNEKLKRDIPEYYQKISLAEGMKKVYLEQKKSGSIPKSSPDGWEDLLIQKLRVDLS